METCPLPVPYEVGREHPAATLLSYRLSAFLTWGRVAAPVLNRLRFLSLTALSGIASGPMMANLLPSRSSTPSLPEDLLEGMRQAYARAAESHLVTVVQPSISKDEVVGTARAEALKMFGYTDEEILGLGDIAGVTMERLQELEDHGLAKRTVRTGRPVRIAYSLTKEGMDIIPVMFAMTEFSMKNFPRDVFEDGKSRNPEQVVREIRATNTRNRTHSFP